MPKRLLAEVQLLGYNPEAMVPRLDRRFMIEAPTFGLVLRFLGEDEELAKFVTKVFIKTSNYDGNGIQPDITLNENAQVTLCNNGWRLAWTKV